MMNVISLDNQVNHSSPCAPSFKTIHQFFGLDFFTLLPVLIIQREKREKYLTLPYSLISYVRPIDGPTNWWKKSIHRDTTLQVGCDRQQQGQHQLYRWSQRQKKLPWRLQLDSRLEHSNWSLIGNHDNDSGLPWRTLQCGQVFWAELRTRWVILSPLYLSIYLEAIYLFHCALSKCNSQALDQFESFLFAQLLAPRSRAQHLATQHLPQQLTLWREPINLKRAQVQQVPGICAHKPIKLYLYSEVKEKRFCVKQFSDALTREVEKEWERDRQTTA